ncbi:unnamed protein product, partial [Rhizoctonia solani]
MPGIYFNETLATAISFLGSSAPSANPSLASASSLCNSDKERLLIEFPLPLNSGWYAQQKCTRFRTFEHRKERRGVRHEFILLKLLDDSVCRVERMGDPNARFDAIRPQGSIAYDIAQSFRPDEMDKACLGTSDIIAEVTLPYNFDIMDVLKICRAIHEGEKTRKYTLQVYNCWFFSLAIQVCLVRMISGWESSELLEGWHSHVYEAIQNMDSSDQTFLTPDPSYLNLPKLLWIYDILASHSSHRDFSTVMESVKTRLRSQLGSRWEANKQKLAQGINDLLWYSTIHLSLGNIVEENVEEAVVGTLREGSGLAGCHTTAVRRYMTVDTPHRFLMPPTSDPNSGSHQSLEQLKYRFLFNLTTLLSSSGAQVSESSQSTFAFTGRGPRYQTGTKSSKECADEFKLDFTGSHGEQFTKNIPACRRHWLKHCVLYAGCFFLWVLRKIASTISGASLLYPHAKPTLSLTIDKQLGNIVTGLQYLKTITCADLERYIEELRVLTADSDAAWGKRPWTSICQFINQCTPDTIFNLGGAELIWFKPQEQHETRSVLDFQVHVLDRIKIHAREVENKWLGSATHIQTELVDVLSQVWKLIREGNDIFQKVCSFTFSKKPISQPQKLHQVSFNRPYYFDDYRNVYSHDGMLISYGSSNFQEDELFIPVFHIDGLPYWFNLAGLFYRATDGIVGRVSLFNLQSTPRGMSYLPHATPAPVKILFPPIPKLEYLLGEPYMYDDRVSLAWPLAAFCTWALQQLQLSEAPVRSVLCNRQGVHEFILLSCDVITSSSAVTQLWFRIERYPGFGALLNKTKPVVNTLRASTKLQKLRDLCELRDSFMYNAHENPNEVLRFKHIAEMFQYIAGHSSGYSLLGANCRWICYALLECLREARPCYGGDWFPSRHERPTADVKVAQLAKSHYLRDKHPTCCGSQYLISQNSGAITRATLGLASIAVSSSSQNTYNGGPQYAADQGGMYGTPRSLPESAISQHQPAPAASAAPQAPSTNRASSSSTIPPNVTQPLQPNPRQNDVSPPPAGANATHHPQSPPIEQTSSAQLQQRNT